MKRWLPLVLLLSLVLLTRSTGLYRGLDESYITHPDAPKQVTALMNFLDGTYIWYVGSLFYDGYPYGLNHVDEWLLRPVFFLQQHMIAWTTPGSSPPHRPDLHTLYYYGRSLRLLYGLLTGLLLWMIIRRLHTKPAAAHAGLLLFALAPVSLAVVHAVTGDIGVDLFLAACWLCAVIYAQQRKARWMILSGISAGLAFSCKYQGALGMYVPGLTLLLLTVGGIQSWKRMVRDGGLCLAGMITGIFAGTPALFIDPDRTWKNIQANFVFLKNYGVDESWLQLPLTERIPASFAANLPIVIQTTGPLLMLTAIAGMIWCLSRLIRKQDPKPSLSFATAFYSFPAVALILAIGLKPEVQPFHFSFIIPPLIAAAVFTAFQLFQKQGPGRLAAILLLALLGYEQGTMARAELYFWGRQETGQLAKTLSREVHHAEPLLQHGKDTHRVRTLALEEATIPVFRNRGHYLYAHQGPVWNAQPVPPVPHIPMQIKPDWIFMNGPLFARSDRMFELPAGRSHTVTLVCTQAMERIMVGIRSADLPAVITVGHAGKQHRFLLGNNMSTHHWFQVQSTRTSVGRDGLTNRLYAFTYESTPGRVWITHGQSTQEEDMFRFFSGDPEAVSQQSPAVSDRYHRLFSGARYLDRPFHPPSMITNAVPLGLFKAFKALPAGHYTITLTVAAEHEENTLELRAFDPQRILPRGLAVQQITFGQGYQQLELDIEKAFIPYLINWEAVLIKGACRLFDVSLRPNLKANTEQIRSGQPFEHTAKSDTPTLTNAVTLNTDVVFDDRIKLHQFSYTPIVRRGTELAYSPALHLLQDEIPDYHTLDLFVHLREASGHNVAGADTSLYLTFVDRPGRIIRRPIPADIEPGTYDIYVGMYNTRTLLRLASATDRDFPITKNAVRIGTLDITE